MLPPRLRCLLYGASNNCQNILQFIAMVIIILFAFVPILCLFTWVIPLIVLERIIPIQFHAFILNIPLIVWCAMTSTLITSIIFFLCYFIDKEAKSENVMLPGLHRYVWSEIKNKLSIQQMFTSSCHLFGITVFCLFCSFIFCVSPALYLCALFWFIYEMMKTDMNINEVGLQIRQHIYQRCFTLFDELETQFKIQNIFKLKSDHKILSNVENIKYLKQIAYHIFCVLLSVKHISDGGTSDGLLLQSYIDCLQNNCKACRHKWEVQHMKLRDFKVFICMEVGAILLIISHLFLFWFWTMNYSQDQVTNISIDFNAMTAYSQLLLYYVAEQSCLIMVFIAAAKIYLDDIYDFYRFEFFKLNGDTFLVQALDQYTISGNDDTFTDTYCKLLYIYLDELITRKTLKLCIKDEWFLSLLTQFVCGDTDINVLCQTELLQLLNESMMQNSSDIKQIDVKSQSNVVNNEENAENDNLIVVPMQNVDTDQEKSSGLSDFAMYFTQSVNNIPSTMQSANAAEIKQLIIHYVNFCCMNSK